MQILHIPVLLEEVKQSFENVNEGLFLDCTLGYGGHSYALLKAHSKLKLIACDKDEIALNFSKDYLKEFVDRITFYHCDFREILDKIDSSKLRGILADIGVSSLQLDKNERGFSIRSDYLDMRMDKNSKLSAFEVINSYSKEKLTNIFKEYAQLNNAFFLAEKICKARVIKEIKSAKELCEIIGFQRQNNRHISQAILVFQAIRIEVNDELNALNEFLLKLEKSRLKECVVAIICFHSLEDKIVKNFFKKWEKSCICDLRAVKCECGNNHSLGHIVNKKVIRASKLEIEKNSRASCAKMRVFYFSGKNEC
ncbi:MULTISPECIES: 16S rRNA (cytosine(1402)-N(4))-methyltransferase RsmH [unclassified Campylobacter]|uniref:16S rRNA (cytosine(1402)-N(4))-methyltransferase RsmH n=1 Tax=unclassified Campylobacter TaxID=2593542 RepID=UPI001237C57B|nr:MULTISPECIES: 16S rRNA (cytosine(1402)-N(4))-methyltransferase RsmH [unclassified Campylobacter]KAA6228466.1 16S rRNA (cytosine(1402)-N(4))-methyltransferase RsmH [Campylobacter sp. LR185c]KAA6228952.1 16S rRNA (cytosine(1402)-N(4))-methyltransferase RsmH [Campylobacter sp. LR196d]KAA6229438.1 16S rRNA (cytosine(1402)-N(4))-methyltransferase RsmH [Campylobacter sp. LR286c]KAA6229904.1 16S rRNA (cytosine(1402)-N(4))-methyltransferase RsmH [Campylobacter sp. LR264d]KAA6234117.1 16S rRNA (cyto